jgi:hypothetical protein
VILADDLGTEHKFRLADLLALHGQERHEMEVTEVLGHLYDLRGVWRSLRFSKLL